MLSPYEQQYYVTFNQLKAVGGSVVSGEKGHFVVFRKIMDVPDKEDKSKTVKKPLLRYYYIFNISQCKDIPSTLIPKAHKRNNIPVSNCEFIIEDMPDAPKIGHWEGEAYYLPAVDYVCMPYLELFDNSDSYYTTLFHEIIHSTGHISRLNRKEVMDTPDFGTELYSVEELTAEIGACYLDSYCGRVDTGFKNSVGYIQSWLSVLRNDKKCIVQAASRAQQAVDYILNVDRNSGEPEVVPAEEME